MASKADAPLETSYASAPDDERTQGEAKLLIKSRTCIKRNKMAMLPSGGQRCYKPTTLSSLDNDLFHNFTSDLQTTMKYQWCTDWVYFGALLFFLYLPLYAGWIFVLSCSLALLAFLCGFYFVSMNQRSLQSEIEARVEEWQPLLEEQGYSVDYVVDKPHWWSQIETYVHIHQNIRPQGSHVKEEAKYLVFFPIELRRRTKTFRILEDGGRLNHYIKPPALRNLEESVFRELLRDLEVTTTLSNYGKFMLFSLVMLVPAIVLLSFLPGEDFTLGWVDFCAALYLVERCIRLYTGLFPYAFGVTAKVEEWKPRLAEHGFNVDYIVDQPAWWSWREDYLHIKRQSPSLGSF
jgi:hypothetical protein